VIKQPLITDPKSLMKFITSLDYTITRGQQNFLVTGMSSRHANSWTNPVATKRKLQYKKPSKLAMCNCSVQKQVWLQGVSDGMKSCVLVRPAAAHKNQTAAVAQMAAVAIIDMSLLPLLRGGGEACLSRRRERRTFLGTTTPSAILTQLIS